MKLFAASAILILIIGMAAPQALANPGTIALQVATSTAGTCFGLNGMNDSFIPATVGSMKVAVIQPIFTSTPYSQYATGSFYAFYAKETGVTTNVTTNLNDLSTNVSSGENYDQGWGLSNGMYEFLKSQTAMNCGLVMGKNLQVLTDIDVANGGLFFANGSAKFDAVILPFSEYVEQSEYSAYEQFVAGGGTMVMMGHSLEYPVTYNATTNMETLVYGHNWAFNGQYAYPIACGSNSYVAACPWAPINTDWIGSNTCEASCYKNIRYNGSAVDASSTMGKDLSAEFGSPIMKTYKAHEEDTITNTTDTTVVSTFFQNASLDIASYTHQFKKGMVVSFDVFGDDIIGADQSAQYFLLLGLVSQKLGLTSVGPLTSSSSATTTTTSTTVISNRNSSESSVTTTTVPGTVIPSPFVYSVALTEIAVVALVVIATAVVWKRRGRARS